MSGKKCSYFSCCNSLKNTPGLRRFTFPIKDPDRCQTWIANSGKFISENLFASIRYLFWTWVGHLLKILFYTEYPLLSMGISVI